MTLTLDEATLLVAKINNLFGSGITREGATAWAEILRAYNHVECNAALMSWASVGTHRRPTPGDLIEIMKAGRAQAAMPTSQGCGRCGDTGFSMGEFQTDKGVRISAAYPCPICERGRSIGNGMSGRKTEAPPLRFIRELTPSPCDGDPNDPRNPTSYPFGGPGPEVISKEDVK